MKMIIILKYQSFFMSIFKRIFSSYISHKKVSIRNSLIASAALFSINTNGVFAESKTM